MFPRNRPSSCRASINGTSSCRYGSCSCRSTAIGALVLGDYLVVHDKRGRSELSLSDVLDINYRTASRLLQKIREAMKQRDANYQLSGLVEMDDAYFGGRKKGTDGRGMVLCMIVPAVTET